MYYDDADLRFILDVKPAFDGYCAAVVLSSDEGYAPYLAVCIKSLVENSNSCNNYDILILDGGISNISKKWILASEKNNVKIRFINMIPIISGYDTDIFSLAQHFTIATYFRFFVPDILTRYNKVVFLDCDMAVLRDVADLYKMELDGYYIAAAHDVDISMRVANAKHENWVRYYHEVLKLQDVNDYFQAGCLLMNLELMRKNNITEQLLMELMRIKNPRYSDQCVLNAVCKGYVKRLPLKWNYTWHLVLCNDIGRITEVWRNEYIEAGKDPYIIHFSGTGTKPWLNPSFNGAYIFWKYARLTPFYERLLSNITTSSLSNLARHIERLLGVALEYKKIKWKYFIHKLASRITFGKAYKRHREKAKSLKSILRSFQHNTIEKL